MSIVVSSGMAMSGLLDAVPQRIGVVGEIVEDAQPAAHLVDRHPASRRERLEVFHRHRAHAHAALDRRVQLVQQQRRDVARRSGREFHAVGEEAAWAAAGRSARWTARPRT